MQNKNKKGMAMKTDVFINGVFIKKIVTAPYICTVPSSGVKATKCYQDAKTFIINGRQIGWSKKEKTIIIPLDTIGNQDEIDRRIDILTSTCIER